MIKSPGIYNGAIAFNHERAILFPGDCEDVRRFVNEYNAAHPKLTFELSPNRLFCVTTELNDKDRSIRYKIY